MSYLRVYTTHEISIDNLLEELKMKTDLEIIRFLLIVLLIWCGVLSWLVAKPQPQPKAVPTYIINTPPPLEIIEDLELI